MQIKQPQKTTTAHPWATLIITISINLACQVSPLEDTLVLTKKDNVPLQTVGHSKRSPLHTPMTQILHKPDCVSDVRDETSPKSIVTLLSTIYRNSE